MATRFGGTMRSDVVVVGAGAAGLSAALGCVGLAVTVLTKTRLGDGAASGWAQGGVASAVGDDDSTALHAADTMAAGAGLNDRAMVEVLTTEGPARVEALVALGAEFDRDSSGHLELGREGAHSRRRIVHAHGDGTGAEILRTLVGAVRSAAGVRVLENVFAIDLVRDDHGAVVGVLAQDEAGEQAVHLAPAVVLATGGCGGVYLFSTNPPEATGDGLAMAARAGARLVDLEFMQFHPTALAVGRPGVEPLPLLTEALRGEGAILIDESGARFMLGEHPDHELAPRDIVARAIWRRMRAGQRVFLDARAALGQRFPDRFPTVYSLCMAVGIDPRYEPMPVTPAAHYHMGGIAVDEAGRTSLNGLWACGEVASSGVHGANRLASNSLLEALVFGARVAADLRESLEGAEGRRVPTPRINRRGGSVLDTAGDAKRATEGRRVLWEDVGLVRDEQGLRSALARLELLSEGLDSGRGNAANLLAVGRLIAAAALQRRESRGSHYRLDYPLADPAWRRRLYLTAAADGSARFESARASVRASQPR
jgi:L-aspartate oxidase